MKKNTNNRSDPNESKDDQHDEFESGPDTDREKNEGSSNIMVNSGKVDDQDFNNFINEEYLDGSEESSFNFSITKPINLDYATEGKKYAVLKGMYTEGGEDKEGALKKKVAPMDEANQVKELTKGAALVGINKGGVAPKGDGKVDQGAPLPEERKESHGDLDCMNDANSVGTNSAVNLACVARSETGSEVTLNPDPLGRIHPISGQHPAGSILPAVTTQMEFPNEYLNNSSMASSVAYRENELCFIKYLVVCNFKSYEGENIIGPFSKFTAIIGPNGSGKSNIMDCICFVLGIHNKCLRVKSMKQLIHHKENEKVELLKKRKCYVKLILECNKETVEIKRTLNYRGGSNYYINEKLVEHKEYIAFLKKNRIETKTKTCLIFQGDIEDVINKKPNELAKLFEYISGSDEYEQVYEDMKEKLKEKQMTCKRYLNEKKKIEQEIKIHKMHINDNIEQNQLKVAHEEDVKTFYLFRLYHLHRKKEKLKEDLVTYKEEKIEFEQEVLCKDKEIANHLEKNKLLRKKALLKVEEEIRNYRVELNKLKVALNEINEKKKFNQDSLVKVLANQKLQMNIQTHCTKFSENLHEQVKEQTKKLRMEISNKLGVILKFMEKYNHVKSYIQERHTTIFDNLMKVEKSLHLNRGGNKDGKTLDIVEEEESIFEKCNVLDVIENLSEYKKCKEKYLYLCANSNISINNYNSLANALKKDIKELQEECDNLSRKKQKEVLDYEAEKLTMDEVTGRVNTLNILIEGDKKKIENFKVQLRDLHETISQKEKRIEQLDKEINILNIHKTELIHFEKKKETISSLKNFFGQDQIYDEISSLYEVNNHVYFNAVNNAIHKYNNFLVVKNVEIAAKCIKYLKDNKLHKMDFIPLENFIKNLKRMKGQGIHEGEAQEGYEEFTTGHGTSLGERNSERRWQEQDNHMMEKIMNTFKKKNIVLANNCLVCDEQFKVLFDYLIGKNTLIVERIKDAEEIRSKFPQMNANMVTLNGHIISKHNNLIVDISSTHGERERYSSRRLDISMYNKILTEKEECKSMISECNQKIIQTNEQINKTNYELELNKKKVASLLIKKGIFEKEVEGKEATIQNYEERIIKIKDVQIKKKMDNLQKYESELMKERKGLASYQMDSFKILNERFQMDNIYEAIEKNSKEMEKIDDNIDRIKNNIKKLKDDINELTDKKNEIQLFHKKEKIANQEENIKLDLYKLDQEEKEQMDKMNETENAIQERETERGTHLKNLGQINQELNDLRDRINSNIEKYESMQSKVDNCRKKIVIYVTLVKDLIGECDMNGVNVFAASYAIADEREDQGDDKGAGRHKGGRSTRKGRVSKLLQGSEEEDSDVGSAGSGSSTRGSEDEEENQVDITLANISFDALPDELKKMEKEEQISREEEKLEKEIEKKKKLLKMRNINTSAEKEYENLIIKLKNIDASLSNERKECNLFERNFRILQKKRSYKFLHCFNYIKNVIDNVYNNLTYNVKHHVGGQAFLDLFNLNEFNKDDEPFYCGIRYNNMPPMKRFFEISELSGGEKSMSALALIFSIQKYISNSFIILDEVDANMDPIKMSALARYLNSINSQVIVISLKEKFFSKCQTLIGVYKNKHKKCSRTVTLDICRYRQEA
ncbi:structural maintenance of chromosome protein, putative [Plasmodium knowlesi strain H]|uniref:Structural maintenance of chromosome protein, putative n=3 Tax=Plasmodium knowlesi TaxID=5850 RepID=A0A5K1VQK0_PLAKH|nr:structural maintenance of chromosomes protein 1, putative [Plasmodium knowlesi strain H]OTN64829.1 putative Structural maintenance of chromosome protein [Plasmodium knowlesi]CAA9988332.1 structural maintenance of chromosomes protein 1, putative [Plasmodium knowlesi strain H]SBO20139.1 structural maintenance of chromosome protein, putative [Plasmodium knowlesi strain H]SBO20284.1 structural maintenance of chromosome protein, putative [Plasmodium knowlesi strain H]VVS77806.1 structural mainte|eukprot:XP_002259311.1 structural maintenance of chromosome protein,putative [Plasmodium knowlesi strain H]